MTSSFLVWACLRKRAVTASVNDTCLLLQVTTLTVCALLEAAEAAGEGKWLVQTAGGSALGRQVISMAKHRGIKLVNLVRRAAQKDELLELRYAYNATP